ncbi:MAG: hypothetical protein V4751_06195 [Pseudomonadota bacterium]
MTILQKGMTVLIPVTVGKEAALTTRLESLTPALIFGTITGLHCLSMTVLPGEAEQSLLLLELNFDCAADGSASTLVAELWQQQQTLWSDILGHCAVALPQNAQALQALLTRHDRGEGTYFVALPGADLDMIRRSQKLLEAAREIAANPDFSNATPREFCERLSNEESVARHLQNLPEFWPEARIRNAFPAIKMLFGVITSVLLLIGSGLGYPDANGTPAIAVTGWIWGFALLVGAMLAWQFLAPASVSRPENTGFRIAVVVWSVLLALGFLLAWKIKAAESLVLVGGTVLLTLTWLLFLFDGVNRVRKSAFIEAYISHLGTYVLGFLLLLAMLQFLAPSVLSRSAAVLSGGLYVLALLAWLLLSRIPGFGSVSGSGVREDAAALNPLSLGATLGLLLVLLLPHPWIVELYPVAHFCTLVVLMLLLVVLRALCILEQREKEDIEAPPFWQAGINRTKVALQESRTHGAKNHLLSCTAIKPGRLRYVSLWVVLKFVGLLNKLQGTRSELSGITTIHFARWVILDRKRLLFMSNYSGTWDSYLDEFIDQSHAGITSIWSNTAGFPNTRWLSGGGAELEQRFKIYARNSQWPTACHYCAYPEVSVDQIENQLRLNAILKNPQRTDADCEAVVRML